MRTTQKYNNFEDSSNNNIINRNPGYVSYNNFGNNPVQVIPNQVQVQQPKIIVPKHLPKLDPTDEESIGEYIYTFADTLYPRYLYNL